MRTFGIITCFGGLLGVMCGSIIAEIWAAGVDINFGNIQRCYRRIARRLIGRNIFIDTLETGLEFTEDYHLKIFPNDQADP